MTIEERINGVRRLLRKVADYRAMVVDNTLAEATNVDMKNAAKDTCDAAKAEIDNIKSEVDDWGAEG